ncbi:NAD-dependent epimerase/dehydratase family protein, partial [Streptomyces sp. ID05-39B]|uniref:NAD-dependent epimerase/dehydratase family protein n=1 Tax=Streptomyces sp. ID05-39B TaxID=3028664 RepID=UPI0029AA799E
MERRRIAVAGASGLIGSALVRSLTADGHEVVRLVRHAPRSEAEVRWDPERGRVDAAGLAGCCAVVNLAGAGVGDHRWTDAYKRRIHDSRVHGTAALAKAVAALDERPRVFVNGSAMGYYGETGERVVDEGAPAGRGFLPELCVEWEAAAEPARAAGVRTAFTRTGLVVARGGGAWGRLFPLF